MVKKIQKSKYQKKQGILFLAATINAKKIIIQKLS